MKIAEVNHRMSDDVSCFTYDQTQAAIGMKERQPIRGGIFANSALASARNLARPHQSLDLRHLDAKALPEQLGVHADGTFFDLDI
jgi:hypothetical protein